MMATPSDMLREGCDVVLVLFTDTTFKTVLGNELSCGPATPVRTNNRHCTGLTGSAAQRAARQLQRVVRPRGRARSAEILNDYDVASL